MSLLYFNGFDFLTTTHFINQAVSYSGFGIFATTRYGYGNSAGNNTSSGGNMYVGYTIPDTGSNYIIFGVAIQIYTSSPAYTWGVHFINSGGPQCSVWPGNLGTWALLRGDDDVLIDTSAEGLWEPDSWYYLEGKFSCTNSSDYEIRLDGETIMSGSGADLQYQSTPGATRVSLYGGWGDNDGGVKYDDLYVCDDQGSKNNDFLGEVVVRTLLPDGAGTHTEFTPSEGSNYENVDDTTPDDDTTYNSTGVVDSQDSYAVGDLPDSQVAVHGVRTRAIARKEGAGYRALKNFVIVNSSKYDEAKNTLNLTYDVQEGSVLEDNPDDSQDWEVADINAMEVGVQLSAVQTTTTTTV